MENKNAEFNKGFEDGKKEKEEIEKKKKEEDSQQDQSAEGRDVPTKRTAYNAEEREVPTKITAFDPEKEKSGEEQAETQKEENVQEERESQQEEFEGQEEPYTREEWKEAVDMLKEQADMEREGKEVDHEKVEKIGNTASREHEARKQKIEKEIGEDYKDKNLEEINLEGRSEEIMKIIVKVRLIEKEPSLKKALESKGKERSESCKELGEKIIKRFNEMEKNLASLKGEIEEIRNSYEKTTQEQENVEDLRKKQEKLEKEAEIIIEIKGEGGISDYLIDLREYMKSEGNPEMEGVSEGFEVDPESEEVEIDLKEKKEPKKESVEDKVVNLSPEKRKLLENKLEVYKNRLKEPGSDKEDTNYKIFLVENVLRDGKIESDVLYRDAIKNRMTEGENFSSEKFKNAYEVIEDYVKTGGKKVTKGGGLEEKVKEKEDDVDIEIPEGKFEAPSDKEESSEREEPQQKKGILSRAGNAVKRVGEGIADLFGL